MYFKIIRNRLMASIAIFITLLLYICFSRMYNEKSFWWNSVITFGIGIMLAYYKGKIYLSLKVGLLFFLLSIVVLLSKTAAPLTATLYSIAFVMIPFCSMRNTDILQFLGKNSLILYLSHALAIKVIAADCFSEYLVKVTILTAVIVLFHNIVVKKIINNICV